MIWRLDSDCTGVIVAINQVGAWPFSAEVDSEDDFEVIMEDVLP
jgi:hypothetical protein